MKKSLSFNIQVPTYVGMWYLPVHNGIEWETHRQHSNWAFVQETYGVCVIFILTHSRSF